VDHKKSGTPKRVALEGLGWDLQLGLYREMLKRPEKTGDVLEAPLAGKPQIGSLSLINDRGFCSKVLSPPDRCPLRWFEGEIISLQAMTADPRGLRGGAGTIPSITTDDRKILRENGKPRRLCADGSPLARAFMMPGTEAETAWRTSMTEI